MSLEGAECTACGTETVAGAAYCHRCGAFLAPEERPAAAPTARSVGAAGGFARMAGGPSSAEGTGTPDAGVNVPGQGAAPVGPEEGPAGGGPPSGGAGWGSARDGGARVSADEVRGAAPDPATDEGIARALRGDYPIAIGHWMSRGWTTFTRAGGLFIGFAAIEWLLYFFALPVWILLAPVLTAGLFVAALKVRRGERLQFSDFWLSFNDFIPLSLAGLVSTALMFAGLCTCGIATIYLWVAYQFPYLLILDRRMEFWDALETSRKATTRQWFGLFMLALVIFLLNLVAFLVTLSLGLIVTIPFTACVVVEAYADVFGVREGLPGRSRVQEPTGASA